MQLADYVVLILYLLGTLAVGVGLMVKVKNTSDLFTAGGQSPWWASGLSAFMTMFSAGTFVVWGGIAYRLGLVAVTINLCYGIAAILVGWTVAGRWKKLGIRTPAEYVRLRFGKSALHFYTLLMLLFRMVGSGVALYALAVMLCALMPLSPENPLRDPQTGNLALFWAITLFGGITVLYTMLGGLWAVLMTDVLQFLVLNLAVLFVIPLLILQLESWDSLRTAIPEGFLRLTADRYTWLFLLGWVTVHYFMIGAEWAFVQRFLCVPSGRDARRVAMLFGGLYLFSPFLWMFPPLIYRLINPHVDHEQAYVLSCVSVLPTGLVGLLLSAMFSATASLISSQLNVFAGVLTEDLYRPLRPEADEKEYVWAGRFFSCLLGVVLISVALAVPRLGGAEKTIIAVTNLMVTPLLAPMLLGLIQPRMSRAALWTTCLTCLSCALASRLLPTATLTRLQDFFGNLDVVIGVLLPLAILALWLLLSRKTDAGWKRLQQHMQSRREAGSSDDALASSQPFDSLPGYLVAGAIAACSLMSGALLFVNQDSPRSSQLVLVFFSIALALISLTTALWTARTAARCAAPVEISKAETS